MAAVLESPAVSPVVVDPSGVSRVSADAPGISDGELIARVARRDHAAFEELHRRYVRAVLGLALRRIGDRGRAEDATQETFAAIWRSAARYDAARGPGAPWLYTVARNTIANGLRRAPEPTAAAAETATDDAGPPEQAEASWEAWTLHRALEELPARERQVVELAYWSGLSQSEIASFLDIPLGTVKTRVRAALHRLADALERELR